jgi:hypothetical protein
MENIITHIIFRDGHARLASKPNLKAEMVALMYLGEGYTLADVMEQYNISAADVYAALTYYYDNQTELDERRERIEREIRENAINGREFLETLRARLKAKQQQDEIEK